MIKQKITNLIAAGRIDEALQFLLAVTEGKDEVLNNDLIILSSQLSADNRRNNSGILDYEELKLSENKIVNSLLAKVAEINESGYFDNLSLENLVHQIESGDGRKEKMKILFIASNPVGTPKFELEKEYLGIRKIFNSKRKEFELMEIFDAKLDDLFDTIQKEKPDIIHISAPSTDEHLYLQNADNSVHKVCYNFLSSAFLMFKNYTDCVFLNTCTSPIFLKKVSKSLNYAIGSDGVITDEDSINFSSGFYTGISMHKNIEESFELGLKVLEQSRKEPCKKIDTLLLFKTGFCANKEDNFPESFLNVKSDCANG